MTDGKLYTLEEAKELMAQGFVFEQHTTASGGHLYTKLGKITGCPHCGSKFQVQHAARVSFVDGHLKATRGKRLCQQCGREDSEEAAK